MSPREKELEKLVRELMPAARDILWCALVWNDHNFTDAALLEKSQRAAQSLGYKQAGLGANIEAVNKWMARIDRTLGTSRDDHE